MNNRFLSLPEVQQIAGNKSHVTIWRWVRDGIFPSPRKIGPNSIACLESELDEWIDGHSNVSESVDE